MCRFLQEALINNNINSMQQPKTRNSNLELYRILVMWVIVIHHYVVNSGLLDELALNSTSKVSLFCYLAGGGG